MKKIALFLLASVFACSLNAQLVEVFTEVYYVDDGTISEYPEGATTHRIYASLADSDDVVTAVFANSSNSNTLLLGGESGEMWNTPFGGITGPDLNAAFFGVFPNAEYDSFVTIGRAHNMDPGGAITAFSTEPASAFTVALSSSPGTDGYASNLEIVDGTWFTTPDQVNAQGQGDDFRVLLAQITCIGIPEYQLNLQMNDGGVGGTVLQYVWDEDAVVEGTNTYEPTLVSCFSGTCSDPLACNYDPDTICEDTCYYVEGCTDITSCSYDPEAGCDDGSCGPELAGCLNIDACNYNVDALCDNGVCFMPGCLDPIAQNYDASAMCSGECLYWGCTNSEACNFDPDADVDDGTCLTVYGCTDITSCSYDVEAVCDDGSCSSELAGCLNQEACNYDASALCDNQVCIYPTCDDPLAINYDPNGECAGDCIYDGCMDINACNYEPTASEDNGNCIYPGCSDPAASNFDPYYLCPGACIYAGCMDPQACNYDPVVTEDAGDCTFPGCTDLTACNFDAEAGCDNGSCTGVVDCTDPGACNYTPSPTGECGEACFYPGCNDLAACNYQWDAGCDDGSCDYGTFIQLFYDQNQNGIWNTIGADAEGVFGAVGSWSLEALGLTLFADDEGRIDLPAGIPAGTYLLEFNPFGSPYFPTNLFDMALELPLCTNKTIGISSIDDFNASVNTPCCIWLFDIHCVGGINPGYNIWNSGTAPISGTVTVTRSPQMTADQLSGATAFDELTDTQVIWNIENQAPGTMQLYQCHLNPPAEFEPGEIFEIILEVELVNSLGEVWHYDTMTLTPEVICSYDPNDKYAVPEGYAEPNYIPQEDEIEYRIRFQNTGNAAAIDVRIEDQLDAETLDLDSFYPVFGSHDFTTCLTAEGHVTFNFNEIMLPDSTTDEPGSQGYVVYRVRPLPDLPHGTEIHNTAEIYFDINDPIITNTTLHTIMECTDFAQMAVSEDPICEGEELVLETGTPDYVDEYSWIVMGDLVSEEAFDSETFDEEGSFYLEHTVSNPICTETVSQVIEVNPSPDFSITEGELPCGTGAFEISVSTESTFQWDGLAENEALNTELSEPTTFNVQISTTDGCTVEEQVTATPLALPITTFSQTGSELTADDGSAWQWYLNGSPIDGATTQTITAVENGDYAVKVTSENGCTVLGQEVSVTLVSIDEFDLLMTLSPNPASESLLVSRYNAGPATLTVLDMQGRSVQRFQLELASQTLDISQLASGNYLVILEQEGLQSLPVHVVIN